MDVFDVCAQIRMDAGKGKKCPGGYWIPQKNKCGGKSKLAGPDEGGDNRRRNRRRLAIGLGAGLGGAAVLGAGAAALAARKGKGEEASSSKPGPTPPPKPGDKSEPRSKAAEDRMTGEDVKRRWIESFLDYERMRHSGPEAFDEAGHRKLAEMSHEGNKDLDEVGKFQIGLLSDVESVAKSIKSLEGMGVGNAVRQSVENELSVHEAEIRRLAAEPSTGTEGDERRKRKIKAAQMDVARQQALLDLFSRKDSLYWDENYTLYM